MENTTDGYTPQPQVSAAPFGQPQPAQAYGYNPQTGAYVGSTGAYANAGYAGAPNNFGYPPPAQKEKKHGWIVALIAVVLIFVLGLVSIASCASATTSMISESSNWSSLFGDMFSTDSELNLTSDTIAVVRLDGTIQYDGTVCSPEGFSSVLEQAQNNSHIKALVIYVNSGGGYATAGEEMTEALKDFTKPVVVYCSAICASAAYEIASQADYIVAAKSSEVGCIGTAMEFVDYSGYYDKEGIKIEYITSSDSKDSSYGTRELTDEERAWYQKLVDETNDCFLQNVAEGRDLTLEEVEALANGLPYSGISGVEVGLVDATGMYKDAVAKAAELAGLEEGKYSTYELSVNYYMSLISDYLF